TRMFWAHLCDPTEALNIGRSRFEAIYPSLQSEIISIGASQYDLRHPDIARFAMEYFYQVGPDGRLTDLASLEADIYAMVRAVHRLCILENDAFSRHGRAMLAYLY